jgi:hypothetical protein
MQASKAAAGIDFSPRTHFSSFIVNYALSTSPHWISLVALSGERQHLLSFDRKTSSFHKNSPDDRIAFLCLEDCCACERNNIFV